jgi:hypothetical protein
MLYYSWIWIFVIILILGWNIYKAFVEDEYFIHFILFISEGIGITLIFAFLMASISEYLIKSGTPVPHETRLNIKSISLNNNLFSNEFVIGWKIENNQMIYYFNVEDQNGLKLQSCKASEVYIKEIDSEPAYVDKFDLITPKYPNWTLSCDNPNNEKCRYNHKIILELPKNTVKVKFIGQPEIKNE